MAITKDLLDLATSGSLDPKTGLQGQPKKQSSGVTAETLDIILKNPVPQPSVGAGSLGIDYTKYKNYGGMPVDTDLIEYRATNQSVGEQLAFGTGRLIGTTATKFLSGIGYILSAIPAVMAGDMSVMLDNGFSEMINDGEEWLKEEFLPIHHKRKYLEGNIFNQMGTFSFWMDDFVDGAAFMLSAIVGAKGLNAIGGSTKTYSKLAQLASKYTKAAKLGTFTEATPALAKWAKFTDYTTINLFNSSTEAAFEAKDVKDSVLRELEDRVRKGEITQEQANVQASDAARNTFWWNMAALMPSNMITNSMVFKKFDDIMPNLSLGTRTIGKEIKPLSNLQKAGIFGKKSIVSSFSEGVYEENIQTAVQNYYKDKATAFDNADFVDDFKGVMEQYVNNFSTDEGQKSIMLGAIIGFLPGGYAGMREASTENKKQVAQQNAMATLLDSYKTGTHAFYKTKESVVAPGTEVYVVDSKGKPVIDEEKVRAGFASFYDSVTDLAASLKAVNSSNKLMFNYIRNNNFAKVVAGFYGNEAGTEALDEWIDFQIETEKEALTKEGYEPSADFLADLREEYKDKGKKLLNRLRQIDNTYAGIIDLPNTPEAAKFRNLLKTEQYGEAVNQLYWSGVADELNQSLDAAIKDNNTALQERIKTVLGEVESVLEASSKKVVELLDPKKQIARFEREQAEIEETIEGKGAVDGETAEQPSNVKQEDTTTPKITIVSNKQVETPTSSVINQDGTTTKTKSVSVEQALANGYTQDATNPSVFYKADKENDTLHSITVDNDNNIVKDTFTNQRKFYSVDTNSEKQVAANFVNGKLKNVKVKDVTSGIVKEYTMPSMSLNDIEIVFSKIKAQLNLKDELTTGEKLTAPKLLDEIKAEMRNEMEEIKDEIKEYIKSLSEKLSNDLAKGAERNERRKKLAETLNDIYLIRRLYGDSRYDGISIDKLFSDKSIKYIPVVMGLKSGILENKDGQILFIEITEEGKLGKEYYIGGETSTSTIGELDMVVLKQVPFDLEIVADGRTYNIQGTYYNNLFENPTEAIEYTPEGEVESITLWDSENNKIRFTNDFLIQNIAYAIELVETVEQKVFDEYIKDDNDFVVYSYNNKDYAVYRKDNGKYSIIDVNTERPIRGKLHTDVKNSFLTQLHEAINRLTVSKINEINSTRKDIRDELRKIATDIRTATSREAVNLPDKSETKDPEGREEKKGRTTSAKKAENVIKKIVIEKAAEMQVAEGIKQKQIKQVEEQQQEADILNYPSEVEILSDNEVAPGSLELPAYGIRHSATASAYVWYDRDKQKYVVNNEEFHIAAINAGETEVYFIPVIDFENNTFWKNNESIKEELLAGNLSKERIEEILTVSTNDFNNPVDTLPIKLIADINGKEYSNGIFYHSTAYDKITVPDEIKAIKNSVERAKAYEKHVREVQMSTRQTRKQILARILNNVVVTFSSSNKTLGTPNNTGINQNLGDVLKRIDPNIDLRNVTLGIGVRPGQIYKNKEDFIDTVGNVGKGNVVLETSYTANGRPALVKLNPSRLSLEHAKIVFKALQQAYQKDKGGFAGKYVGDEVTGDLTRLEVLNLLVYYGESNTKVDPKQFRLKGHLKNKQLWVEKAKILHFGEQTINLHTLDKAEIKKFLDWAVNSKNYAVNRHLLGTTLKGKDKFSIGSFKYDSAVDNYTSFVIKNGIVKTDVDIVPGTKSLFKQPVVGIDLASGGIDLTVQKVTDAVVKQYFGIKQKPLERPTEEQPTVEPEQPTAKAEKNTSAVNLNYGQTMRPLTSNAGIITLPVGSVLYVPIKENEAVTKYKVGRIAKSSSTGKIGFVSELALNHFMLDGIKKVLTSIGSFAFDNIDKVEEFNKAVKSFAEYIHFDSPAKPAETKIDTAPVVNTPATKETLEVPTAKEEMEEKSVEEQIEDTSTGEGYLDLPNTGDTNLDDIDGIYRESMPIEGVYSVADMQRELNALNKRLKANRLGQNIPVDIIDRLIKIGQNRHAFAQFMHDGFKLSKLAEEGSLLHEVFHRVSLGYLTNKERQSLYTEVRNTVNKDFTDMQAEEYLAEKYREYALLKEAQPEVEPKLTVGKRILKFIKDLFNFIYTWFTGKTRLDSYDVATVFKAIDAGRYKYAKISKGNLEQIKGKAYNFEVKETQLTSIQSSQEYREVVQNLFYWLAEANNLITIDPVTKEVNVNISSFEDVSKIKFGPLYNKIGVLRTRYNSVKLNTDAAINSIKDDKLTDAQFTEIKRRYLGANQTGLSKQEAIDKLVQSSTLAERIANIYNEVYEKFDVFKEGIEDFMSGLNIVSVRDNTDIDLSDIDEETGESAMSDIERYNKTSYMVSAKESTQLSIKILMSMLPEGNSRSSLTGLRKFADFSKIWSSTVNDLMGSIDVEDMMNRLHTLSADNAPYQYLLKRLRTDENLKTQFYKSMQKYKHTFINMLAELTEDDTLSYRIISAAIQQASGRYVKDWGSRFIKNRGFFTLVKDKKPQGNIEEFEKLIAKYNGMFKDIRTQLNSTGSIVDLNTKINTLVDMLNTVNIPVESSTIRRAISELATNESEGFYNLLKNKLNYIFSETSVIYKVLNGEELSDSKGKKMSPDKLFIQEKGVVYLADIYAKTFSNELGDSVYGPGGNRYYTIAQNTYISDLLREIKHNPMEFLEKRMSATYAKHSKWLETMLEDSNIADKLELLTMSSFSREDMYDTGREYQGVTSMEDIIMKIVAIENGKLVPPTPADRRFFYFYSGLPTLQVVLDQQGKLSKDVLDVFEGYYKDEVNRINQVRREVELVLEGELDSSTLFETYHYKKYAGRDTKGEGIVDGKVLKESGRYTGRGANFTHFSGFTTSMTPTDVRAKLQEVMDKRIDDTIRLLADNKIISILEENGKIVHIENRLLDNKYIDKYVKLVGNEQMAIRSLIANYTINSQYAAIETGKVFTGDPASFKSSEDYVKRLPGYTSTGDNLRTDFPTDFYAGERLIHNPTYNVTTFSSHVLESSVYRPLVEIHKNYYLSKGMAKTEAQATKMAETKLANLLKVDQTDAQTFISPEMYRAISIRLGEWNNEKENAYQILQSGEISREKAIELSGLVMHPLKMTYMDIIHRDGHMIPVFDKMSMSTLFRPMVKETQLEELLDRMEAKGKFEGLTPIDHVKFHTAEKVGIKDRRELFADKTEKTLTDLSVVEYYPQNFSRLRKQLVTGHDVSRIMVGSQVKKIGISNIFPEEIYNVNGKEVFGEDLRQEVNNILSELSNRGIKRLFNELSIDEKTIKFTDAAKLVERLREEAKQAQLPDYIVEAFKLDANGKFYISIDSFVGNRKWMQSRIISLVKKAAIDLMLPGNAFVQMSDIGLRQADFSDELKIMDEEGYVECKVSISLFKSVIPDFENKTHSERIEYLTKNEEHLALGYRVPTQGQNSVYMLKVVDFLPESIGDTIILPKEGTALGGFDFDIDKLYVIRHNYKNGKKIEYVESEGIEGNTTEALENRLLDDYFSVLKNENHLIRRTTPLGYTADIMKKLASDIRKWKGIKEDVTDALTMVSPAYQLDVKERYKFGKEGLGPFALANVHHVLGQMVKLGMIQPIGIGYSNEDGSTDLSRILGEDGIDITEWFSGLIDAHVDIAADPYIYYLNVNEFTRDLVTLLIRAGIGGTRVFKFVAQPILEDISKIRSNNNNKLGIRIGNAIEDTREEYTRKMFEVAPKEFQPKSFSPDMLADIISEGKLESYMTIEMKRKDATYYNNQLLVLEAFEYLNQYASYLKEAILASRVDTKKFGTSNTEVLAYKNRVLKAYNDMYSGVGVLNFDKLMENTYLNALSKNSIDVIEQVLSNIVLEGTPAFTKFVDKVLKTTGNLYSLNERLLPTLVDDIYTLVYGSFFRTAGLTQEYVKSMLYGENSVPKVIHDIKAGTRYKHLKDNAFIRAMDPVYNEGQPDFISFSKPDNKWYRDDLARAWKDIFAGEIADRDLAIRIFYYSFITSGFKGTVNSFHDLVPLELVKYIGLDNHIKSMLRRAISDETMFDDVFGSLFINNWNNESIVPMIKSIPSESIINFGGTPLAAKLSTERLKRGTNAKGQVIYAPYIKVGRKSPVLYKYVGYLKETEEAVYIPSAKKGYRKSGFVVNESAYAGSIFTENNSPVSPKAVQYYTPEGFATLLSMSANASKLFPGFMPVVDYTIVELKEDTENIISSLTAEDYRKATSSSINKDDVNKRIKDC